MSVFALLFAFLLGSDPVNEAWKSVRALETFEGQNFCTATSINEDLGYFLTAGHCIDTEIGPAFIEGYPAITIVDDDAVDIAVVQVGLKIKSLKMRTTSPSVGQNVYMWGHPVGYEDIYLFKGSIANLSASLGDFPQRFMMFDMQACGGNSGSAVLDSKGRVVSVLQIGHGRPCDGFSGGSTWRDLVSVAYSYFKK